MPTPENSFDNPTSHPPKAIPDWQSGRTVTESSCPVCDWPYPTGGECPWTNRHAEDDDA